VNQNFITALMFTQQVAEFEEQIKKLKAIISEREKEIEEKKTIVKNKDVEISELKDSFENEKEKMKKEVRIRKEDHFGVFSGNHKVVIGFDFEWHQTPHFIDSS